MASEPTRHLARSILRNPVGVRIPSTASLVLKTSKQDASNLAANQSFDLEPLLLKNESEKPPSPPLSRMPTTTLLRSLLLNNIMASSLLRAPCMGILGLAATSKFPLFNPEKNPILKALLYSTAYKQFCAGRNSKEVKKTIYLTKQTGFKGVVLCYGREVVLDKNATAALSSSSYTAQDYQAVEQWKSGLAQTLECIAAGDILAIKFTGAGRIALDALRENRPIPQVLREALDTICQQAAKQGSRLWLDAEQTMLQKTIDEWTIDLMRKYNRNGSAIVSNTIQAYLKSAPENVQRHLVLAAEEGWTLGIKLVRGAYIASDPRHLLHNSIEDTHICFDRIAADLINQRMPETAKHIQFPNVRLFVATHNGDSVRKAQAAQAQRLQEGLPTIDLEFGQLQGMADEVSYELVQESERMKQQSGRQKLAAPATFKYLTWGTLSECLGYLHRRSVENRGAIERTKDAAHALGRELLRRMVG